MVSQDLAVVSLLADMGNGEVQNPTTDLPLVNGKDASVSTPGRIVHWDTEWHWDPTLTQYPHQALGGHIVALGLTNAYQIWVEYTYPIFQWTHQQGGIAGFAHLQYLDDGFPQSLSCCTPIEYPVEVALGDCDFVSEDVGGGDPAIHAYYRLLNCGFRPGFAGGSDSPCSSSIGQTLTYVQIPGGLLTYSNWIGGIARGRTVVSRDGHNEFLDLKVNGTNGPGDEIQLSGAGSVQVTVQWSAQSSLSGTIELVKNGVVVNSQAASAAPGAPATLSASVGFTNSGWLCARRMGNGEHAVNASAVFVTVNHAPVRASVDDARFYVQWMENLLSLTSPGGAWSSYFVTNRAGAQARYSAARAVYQQIASDAATLLPVTINTVTLPYGTVNLAYSTTLTASDGKIPYTWSVVSGSLPPGLALSTNGGAITGTPTATGTFNFTVQIRDASNPTQTAIKPLSITVTTAPLVTIWPSSAAPIIADQGFDNPLELGVKFRSDVAGVITAIRFYKSTLNAGTHLGDLWTSNGTLLASATFTGETASGWQQVNFATPVSIKSNTVYVASYHANNGHYSGDDNFFTSVGVDNPPLHALANGVSGYNGVYSYGTNSIFPTNSWEAANYWVDVAFATTNNSQSLVSITVSPTNSTITTGGSQQFTATGTYSNGSTQDITSQVTWSSTNTAVATVNAAGFVTGVSPGKTAISATLAGVSGSTPLTVQASPLAITTTSLPNGAVNAAYAAILGASGGTTPYRWSITSGLLPSGLGLNTNSGAITGTPNGSGIFNFTVQVSDAGSPVQSVSKPLSLTITAVPPRMTIWPSSAVPGLVDQGPDIPTELGVKFRSDVAGSITAIRFYKASANTGTHIGDLWSTNANGTLLATATFTNETASGWQQVNFATPVAIAANTIYVAAYHANNGHYSEDDNFFTSSGVDNPPLHALANGVSGGDGVYAYGASSTFPNKTYKAANYWVDVVLVTNTAPLLPAQTSRTIAELTPLTVTNTATDTSALTYTLFVTNLANNGVVTNAAISTSGIITWTPTEAQGPGTNLFTTVVSDGSLSTTNSFTVTVNEVNSAPTLPVQTNRTINVLTTLMVTNTATDSDIPANALTYVLVLAPTNALIDLNGVITWTPVSAQGGTTNLFTTRVTDNGTPNLSATNSYAVFVNPAPIIPPPAIESLTLSNGVVTVTWCCLSNCNYRLQYSGDLGGNQWTDVVPDVQATGPTAKATNAVGPSTQRFYRVLLMPLP
jgi:hypothetical protein